MLLNNVLGIDTTPPGCLPLLRNRGGDDFTVPTDDPFQGPDKDKHRTSWLMPRLARRMTKNSEFHVSKWRKPVMVTKDECNRIRKHLAAAGEDVDDYLPKACSGLE